MNNQNGQDSISHYAPPIIPAESAAHQQASVI